MAFIGEVIYEDYLYKFNPRSKSILWGKSNPWKEKYFIIKRVGNKPVLECFNKKPKNQNSPPKGKVELWPSFRVEKVTNMKNRAYVFQITTPAETVCLSSDEQRNMDIFVFFLQIQTRLKDQIRDDYFPVQPENSEAHRRIGAKGTHCLLHVSPYGITLALQSNRSVLAQWPLKSVRSYESSEKGQISLEAGRVAPMGDGMYIFNTEVGVDNIMYDLIDRYVLDALEQIQPGNRGGTEEVEDYVIEAERLLGLTVVSACTPNNSDIRSILQENWSTDLPTQDSQDSVRSRQIVHTRLTHAGSLGSVNSQNSYSSSSQPVPGRSIRDNISVQPIRNSPQMPRSLPPFQNSPLVGPRRGSNQSHFSLADRPPAPTPIASSAPARVTQPLTSDRTGPYLRMDSSAARCNTVSASTCSPGSADWVPPPTFSAAMRQVSSPPIAENGPYRSDDSYLHPPIAENGPYQSDSYLHPVSSPVTSTPLTKGGSPTMNSSYLTPQSIAESSQSSTAESNHFARPKDTYLGMRFKKNVSPKSKHTGVHKVHSIDFVVPVPMQSRARRLRSVSCEDLSDYLRQVVYDPVSKSMNDLLDEGADEKSYMAAEPFPRLQSFSGVIERDMLIPDSYYNIDGLKGKIYDGPGLSVAEIRKRFSKRSASRIRRSVSNPSFIGSLSVEKINEARINIGILSSHSSPNNSRSSLLDVLAEGLKRKLHMDSRGEYSPGGVGGGSPSHGSSRTSSRTSSTQASPHNSLPSRSKHNQDNDIIATTSVKGINITKRSRSFRKKKGENDHSGNQTNHYQSMGEPVMTAAGQNVNLNGQTSCNQVPVLYTNLENKENEPTGAVDVESQGIELSSKKEGPKVSIKPKAAPKPKKLVGANAVKETTSV